MGLQRICIVFTVLGVVACGADMPPTSPTPPPPPPPVVNNTPPTISDLKTGAARVDADNEITVTATVKDAETALDQLTYAWSASPANGTFAGSGAAVKWRAPKGQRTPDVYTLTLTVTEHYTSAGQRQQNTVSSTVTVRYNDSIAEVTGIATEFLLDFGNFSTSAEQCVRNFSNGCNGKAEELVDISANRKRTDYRIAGTTLNLVPVVTVTPDLTAATFLQSCTFEDVSTTNGSHVRVRGDCQVTAIYDNWRWWLCTSHFLNGSVTPLGMSPTLRVPGRILWP